MRIILKISGEALSDGKDNISNNMLDKVLNDVKILKDKGYEIILVLGGGNFFRGRNDLDADINIKSQAGMLSTVINSIILGSHLKRFGLDNKVYSAFDIVSIAHQYNYNDVLNDLKNNKIVILGGGLGVPNFTSDMVTILKAYELNCDMILMGKNIDGIYDKDPKDPSAKKLDTLTHDDLLNNHIKEGIDSLGVIDTEAMVFLCKHKIPLYLYSLKDEDAIINFINKKYTGTMVVS